MDLVMPAPTGNASGFDKGLKINYEMAVLLDKVATISLQNDNGPLGVVRPGQ